MRERATKLAVALSLAVAALACSSQESNIIGQYFNALRANDTQTLTSFAMVAFDKKVDDWKIVSIGPESRKPVSLPELVKRQKEVQAELEKNTREARAWANDLSIYPKLDQVRELEKAGKKLPTALAPIHEKWTTFNDKDRELKKAVADAKAAVEREKRNAQLSVGQMDDIETLAGEMIEKQVDLTITAEGQTVPYLMSLRKYELQGAAGGPRLVSRWVIQSLTPKS